VDVPATIRTTNARSTGRVIMDAILPRARDEVKESPG
jgi:hypothetical protein